jgi:polyisoprenoid-binding protein YceI
MSTQTAQPRIVNGKELPAPGIWRIDPSHSEVHFVARHMMISKVRGRFRNFSGSIRVAEDPLQSSVEATIDAASIDTGDEGRDAHLRSPEFLDAERYPEIRFVSTRLEPKGDRWDKFNLTGDLTIRGRTLPVTLEVEFCGVATDPWGNARAGFVASTEINREEFDITWNQALETGGFVVGKGVKIEVDVEAVYEGDGDAS